MFKSHFFSQRLNPNVEAPVATLIQHLKDDLSSQNLSSKSSSRYMYKIIYSRPPDESKITLQLFSKLPGNVPFRWEFDGREASSDMVSWKRYLLSSNKDSRGV